MDHSMEKRPDAFRGDLGLLLGSFTNTLHSGYEETVLTEGTEEFDRFTNGSIRREMISGWQQKFKIIIFYETYEPEKRDMKFEGMSLPRPSSKKYNRTILVDLGPLDAGYEKADGIDAKLENIRWAIRRGCVAISRPTIKKLYIDPCGFPKVAAESAVYAVFDRNEMYQVIPPHFRPASLRSPPIDIIMHGLKHSDESNKAFKEGLIIGESVNFARLLHGPVSFMVINSFIEMVKERFGQVSNINIVVRDKEWIEEKNMRNYIRVAHMNRFLDVRGWYYESTYEPPSLMEINYNGGLESAKPVILIGKAMFYDRHELMKLSLRDLKYEQLNDVSAGASIAATILAAARLDIPLNLKGIIPFCVRSPHPIKDCFMHIKMPNTYEERLILQDALAYSHDYDPALIMTIATRTGYLTHAFENASSAIYATDHSLADMFLSKCGHSGERFAHLPFLYENDESFKTNLKEQDYSFITSACLRDHALTKSWIHLDINRSAMYTIEKDERFKLFEVTGAPTKSLIEFCKLFSCRQQNT